METGKKGVVLVGHGGIPKDCPQHLVTRLKRLEAQRRTANQPPSQEELDLDRTIRRWPRTAATDPYQAGLEAVGVELHTLLLPGTLFALAYNEFCAPTVEESIEALIGQGATHITVATTMFTPGGSHSEIEIPETLHALQARHSEITIRYAWPFSASAIAQVLNDQVRRFMQPAMNG